jgi:hypothetical protein
MSITPKSSNYAIFRICSQRLTSINLNDNRIINVNWRYCPQSLTSINLNANRIANIDWRHVPWNLDFRNNGLNDIYKEYKESRNNIPDLPFVPPLPFISDKRENFLESLSHTFHLPPKDNKIGFQSPYYKYDLYENGGICFREDVKEHINIMNEMANTTI